ncbi:MAG: DUF2834 domain-containing protein [Methanomicrobiaceae archaeon]|nr:DUF2834 domain-containing protein [Methanomicrobiaceae archaeon]
MSLKSAYAVLSILGLVLPYYFFIGFLMENGPNLALLAEQVFATWITTCFTVNVIVAVIVILFFIDTDGAKHDVPYRWVPALGTIAAGPAFGLPCYLYLRE